jgi:hypothetical protein
VGDHHFSAYCKRGDIQTSWLKQGQKVENRYCSKCGAPTISKCPACSSLFPGVVTSPGVIMNYPDVPPPAYCAICGLVQSWAAKEQVRQYFENLLVYESLSEAERDEALGQLAELTDVVKLEPEPKGKRLIPLVVQETALRVAEALMRKKLGL